jgi:predicted RNA polymerase sigma factor
VQPSPVVTLNRAIAVAERDGPGRGLEEIRAIDGLDRLAAYPFYPSALGELELRRGNTAIAVVHFESAVRLARNAMEQRFFERRLHDCTTSAQQETEGCRTR